MEAEQLRGVYVAYALVVEPGGGQPFGHWLGVSVQSALTPVPPSASRSHATQGANGRGERAAAVKRLPPSPGVRFSRRERGLGGEGLNGYPIFTGIVGPFLVLLHTAFQFRGLAGVTLGLTALVVASGFLGRFFYTAIPRSLAGAEATSGELGAEAERIRQSLTQLTSQRSAAVRALIEADAARKRRERGALALVLFRAWDEWAYRRRLRGQIAGLERVAHVPMGLTLFGAIAIHVGATVYYGAGLWR